MLQVFVNQWKHHFPSKISFLLLLLKEFVCFESGQTINDVDVGNMRSQCTRYSQQIDTLQSQMPTDVQKVSR